MGDDEVTAAEPQMSPELEKLYDGMRTVEFFAMSNADMVHPVHIQCHHLRPPRLWRVGQHHGRGAHRDQATVVAYDARLSRRADADRTIGAKQPGLVAALRAIATIQVAAHRLDHQSGQSRILATPWPTINFDIVLLRIIGGLSAPVPRIKT